MLLPRVLTDFPSATPKSGSTAHMSDSVWPHHLSNLPFSILPGPANYCCLTNHSKRVVLLFLLILCIRKSAEHGGDSLLCCVSRLLELECPDRLFTPMVGPGKDDLKIEGLAVMACRGHKPETVVLLFGGPGLFLSMWKPDFLPGGPSLTRVQNWNLQALVRLGSSTARVLLLSCPFIKVSHRSIPI